VVVLFGAFDRHNLGDILLAHVAAATCDDGAPVFAGLCRRDLTAWSGHRVIPLEDIDRPVTLIHVGGEILDCDADQAAYMLGEATLRWRRHAPYVVPKEALPPGSTVHFRAVGGVALAQREPAFQGEVLAALRGATSISVRDRETQRFLAGHDVAAALQPDPVSRIAELFGDAIRIRVRRREPYLAVQFAAECGDDHTLAALARGLNSIGLPVVLFRAGAAPWHDDLEPYQRLAPRLRPPAEVFESLDVWDICGLIAGSRGFVGTSLHGRIVAEAFGVPAIVLEREPGAGTKLRAYLDTWAPGRTVLTPDDFARGLPEARPDQLDDR
jgi:hypothetical protein